MSSSLSLLSHRFTPCADVNNVNNDLITKSQAKIITITFSHKEFSREIVELESFKN